MRMTIKDFTGLFPSPSAGSTRLRRLDPQDVVRCWNPADDRETESPVKTSGFVYVSDESGLKGWVDQSFLDGFQRSAIDQGNFAAACLSAEADVNDLPDTFPWFVSADFLLARALFETGVSNTVPHASGPDGFGPLLVTRDEWARFLAESTEQDEFSVDGWDDPVQQVWAAAFRMRRDARAIGMIKREAGIGDSGDPFVATLLDLFHAYLTSSPKAAVAILDATKGSVIEVLDSVLRVPDVDAILLKRPEQFGTRAQPLAVADVKVANAQLLDGLLAQAPALVRVADPDEVIGAKPKPVAQVTYGGPLGELIASGEGNYDSYNRGRAGDSRKRLTPPLSARTLGSIMQAQNLPPKHADRLFAVGKYQLIPTTMAAAVHALGIKHDEVFIPSLQEYLFRHYLVARKRPKVKNYITRNGGTLQGAQLALAQEFASVADPVTGRSYYAGSAGNAASISAASVARALQDERELYASLLASGLRPSEAWDAVSITPAGRAAMTLPLPGPSPFPIGLRGGAKLNINLAVQHLTTHAQIKSTGQCARFVRQALEAGGLKPINPPERPIEAKQYGPILKKRGFAETALDGRLASFDPLEGDIVVIQPYPGGNPAGHIAMFSGEKWISDFVQRDVWAGPGYRANKPPIALYRP